MQHVSIAAASLLACLGGWALSAAAQPLPSSPMTMPSAASQPAGAQAQSSLATFARIKSLAGEWQAPLDEGGSMVNIFRPFAYGTKVLAEEWENGKHITSTVFYMVGNQLHADHYCDYRNEPRYTLQSAANDPRTIEFQFREATNLDAFPVHFHSTTWRLVDSNHLVQVWYTEGDKKPVAPIRLAFTRTKLSVREDGSPTVFTARQVALGSTEQP